MPYLILHFSPRHVISKVLNPDLCVAFARFFGEQAPHLENLARHVELDHTVCRHVFQFRNAFAVYRLGRELFVPLLGQRV